MALKVQINLPREIVISALAVQSLKGLAPTPSELIKISVGSGTVVDCYLFHNGGDTHEVLAVIQSSVQHPLNAGLDDVVIFHSLDPVFRSLLRERLIQDENGVLGVSIRRIKELEGNGG